MKIIVNAKEYQVEKAMTISSFIEDFGYKAQRCVVELNGKALRYAEFANVQLADGDVLEVMSLVAGG